MATKKAKKTTKKSAAAPKVTTTVVSKAAPAAKPSFLQSAASSVKDIDGLFSAKTLSLLFVEMIGAMIFTIAFANVQGLPLYVMFVVLGLGVIFSDFSIAFFNPIFILGAWLTRKVTAKKAVLLVIAQVLGTMLAVVVMSSFIKAADLPQGNEAQLFQQNLPKLYKVAAITKDKEWFLFFGEMLGATVLGFLVAQAAKKSRYEKAVFVSLATITALLISSYVLAFAQANTLLNPALAIAAVDFSKEWQWNSAIYVIAPIIGGVLGFFIDKALVKGGDVKTAIKTA